MTGTNPSWADAEIAVVGGGPAGAAAAAWLAEAGRRVLVIERTTGPHETVCGEFVSVEAVALLRRLGLDLGALGAVPVERTRIVAGRQDAAVALPFPALSLPRRVMDEALLAAAAARGAAVLRGATVRSLEPGTEGVVLRLSGGREIGAAAAMLATGKHDLGGRRRLAPGGGRLIGLKQHWRLAPSQARNLEGHVEVHLFPGGYAGLQPSTGGRANLCLVVERGVYLALGRSWPGLLAGIGRAVPLFAERLAGAEPCTERPAAIAEIPYGFVQRGPAFERTACLGDQLAVIPSLSGDGMAIALDSAWRAAGAHLAGLAPPDGARYRGQVARARLAAAALRNPWTAMAVLGLSRRMPGLIRAAARGTRVPGAAGTPTPGAAGTPAPAA
ncbi:NAD(P)/FAD-dependent oxidoreductase [Arenibaculum pallidiluteum]|uniref:NAD(P)/FAD-dependent oxidoreductase n=1 Tax=Arenibaculum pallidiluteum TaxID=2812559 RepID=UPI001A95B92F|nr:FAD-dependent monooxygenase [Arenibaculum pallidiluteum]